MNRTTREKVSDSEELGFLGVDPRDVSEEARQIYNLPAGAFVYSVVEGSPAEKAGIKKGDIITKLDGITISSRDELFSRMEYYKAGESIDVVVKTAEGGEYVENTILLRWQRRVTSVLQPTAVLPTIHRIRIRIMDRTMVRITVRIMVRASQDSIITMEMAVMVPDMIHWKISSVSSSNKCKNLSAIK